MKKSNFKCREFILLLLYFWCIGTVKAANYCGENEKVNTHFYMFLDVNEASFYSSNITDSGFATYTINEINNNIMGKRIIDSGKVAFTDSAHVDWDNLKLWDIPTFWRIYYETYQYKNSEEFSSRVTTKMDGIDFSIDKDNLWYNGYADTFEGTQKDISGTDYSMEVLMAYIEENLESVSENLLIYNGTILPENEITLDDTYNLNGERDYIKFKVKRIFNESHKVEGVSLVEGGTKVIFTPAVYYVDYCEETKASDDPNFNSYIIFDANGGADAPKMIGLKGNECTRVPKETPTLKGQSFIGWSLDENATEPNPLYKSGNEICNRDDVDITLYAVWQTKTGSDDYMVALIMIASISVVCIIYADKHKIFKQIKNM